MKLIFSHNVTAPHPDFGGKANHLIAVKDMGIAVPEFVVIPAGYLRSLLPAGATLEDDFWDACSFPAEFLDTIFQYFEQTDVVAVRSSALQEDGKDHSFAGQYETRLFVTRNTLNDALIAVWRSAFSARVQHYKQQNNIAGSGIAIMVQRMIDADVAGVAFSVNPLTGNERETVINAVWGLGEGIVSGDLNADLYIVRDGTVTRRIADKQWAIVFDEHKKNGTVKITLDKEQSESACLNEQQIIAVEQLVKKMSLHFQSPQDIEFAYHDNTLYLLQTRPVTTMAAQHQEPDTIWDNSNIVESYPGLTLPLTFSFIVKMYEAVYTQLSLILGVRPKTIARHAGVYAHMLGLLWGRVYYNLNNWHQSLSLLPGYKLNAEFMDNMMGVKEQFDTKIESSGNRWSEYFNIINALFKIFRKHAALNKDRIAFQHYFNKVMEEYEAMDFEKMSLKELVSHYHHFENTLVKKWEAPLVNDFFCMIYFGLLQKLVIKYGLDENGTLHNDLVSGSKDIISTEPVTRTLSIADMIMQSPEATILFRNHSAEEILSAIGEDKYLQIGNAIKDYIQKWGDRCVGELKLETITYKQQPENYIKILQAYVKGGYENYSSNENTIRQDAEEKVKRKLKGKPVKRLLFSYVMKKARYLVSHRENLRFERTRGFGMVRIMMTEVGKKLAASGTLQHERDIFYLAQQDVFDYISGSAVHTDLKALVQLRKNEYAAYETIKLPERIKAKGIIYDVQHTGTTTAVQHADMLQGIGCCAGIVSGKVTVVHSPDEIAHLNHTILVTASTDPGWTVLFPGASAIVVERGSLLSHSAIVSREMGIPCIVGVKNLLNMLKTGDLVEIDGIKGTVKILERV